MGLLSTVKSRLKGEDPEFEQEIERAFREGSWPEGVDDFEPLQNTGALLPSKPDIDPLADESLPGNRYRAQRAEQRTYVQDDYEDDRMQTTRFEEAQVERDPREELEEDVRVVERTGNVRPRGKQQQTKSFAERFRERVEAAQAQERMESEVQQQAYYEEDNRRGQQRRSSRQQEYYEDERDIWETRRVEAPARSRERQRSEADYEREEQRYDRRESRREERKSNRRQNNDRASYNEDTYINAKAQDINKAGAVKQQTPEQPRNPYSARQHKSPAFVQPQTSSRTSGSTGVAAYGMGIPTPCEVVYPRKYDDVAVVAQIAVGQHRPVVMVLTGSPSDLARRMIDFSFGICCGTGASLHELNSRVFVLLPTNTALSEADMLQLKRKAIVKG
ncbi:MAG: cell division protein SepF [Coriobacteriales bacterium]|nr:cell division protein SepF [Coriobacteriales bacterium]